MGHLTQHILKWPEHALEYLEASIFEIVIVGIGVLNGLAMIGDRFINCACWAQIHQKVTLIFEPALITRDQVSRFSTRLIDLHIEQGTLGLDLPNHIIHRQIRD